MYMLANFTERLFLQIFGAGCDVPDCIHVKLYAVALSVNLLSCLSYLVYSLIVTCGLYSETWCNFDCVDRAVIS
jgi:hypothetical protein